MKQGYKNTGITWLGNIPENWETKRIKDITKSLVGGGTPSTDKSEYWAGSIPWVSAKDMKYDRIVETIDYVSELGVKESSTKLIKSNSILFVARSGILKHTFPVAINTVPVTINQDLKALEPNKSVSVDFILRCFKGLSSNILMKCQKVGATVDSIEIQELLNFTIAIPPVNEQTNIVKYLDHKTSAIDKKIALLEQKTTHYQQLRKSLINETVCRGLNKSVKLKDSGIEWIGKIPEHWETKRVKELFETSRGRVIGQNELIDNGKYPVYSSQTENDGCLGYIETYDFNKTLITWTTDGANAGTVFKRNGKFNCTNICGILIPIRINVDIDFMTYAVQESAKHNKRIDTNGAKIMSNEMKIINIVFPPLCEQISISTFLNEKSQKIDKIITNIKTQIETLKELRKALINDVVTGKIKVIE